MRNVGLAGLLILGCVGAQAELYEFRRSAYVFVEVDVGFFVDGCYNENVCQQPDGRQVFYGRLGVKAELDENFTGSIFFQHRSNLDIGWPDLKEVGKMEYDPNGFFVGLEYKFDKYYW